MIAIVIQFAPFQENIVILNAVIVIQDFVLDVKGQ